MKGSLPLPHSLTLQEGLRLVGFQPVRGSRAGGSEQDRAGACFGVWGRPARGRALGAGQPLWVAPAAFDHVSCLRWIFGIPPAHAVSVSQPGQAAWARAGLPGRGLAGHAPPWRDGSCCWGFLTQG